MVKKIYYLKEIVDNLPFSVEEIKLFHDEGLIELFFENDEIYFYGNTLERLEIIKRLRDDLGVNIEGIDVILHMREKLIDFQINFEEFIEEIRKEIKNLKKPLQLKEKSEINIL